MLDYGRTADRNPLQARVGHLFASRCKCVLTVPIKLREIYLFCIELYPE